MGKLKVKPCPNCGSEDIDCWQGQGRNYSYERSVCHWCSNVMRTKSAAAQRWNWITPRRLGQKPMHNLYRLSVGKSGE